MSRSLGTQRTCNDPAAELGGLDLANGVANANFYSVVEIICIFDHDYFIQEKDDHLQPGNYYILTNGLLGRC